MQRLHRTNSVLLNPGLYQGGRHHHVAFCVYNHAFALPLIHENEFTPSCHYILHKPVLLSVRQSLT